MRQLVQTVRNLLGLDDVVTRQTQQTQHTQQGEAEQNRQTRWRVRVGTGAVIVIALVSLSIAAIVSFITNSVTTQQTTTVVALHSPTPWPTSSTMRGTTHATEVAVGAYESSEIIVHIVGAVTAPGIYWLRTGARVMDATSAAGGLSPNAQICAINLARVVNDGEQIVIPDNTQAQCSLEEIQRSSAHVAGAQNAGTLVNINTATAEQLDTLPGIGPAIAARIVQWRTEHGTFSSTDQLTDVPGIGEVLMAKLVDLVTL